MLLRALDIGLLPFIYFSDSPHEDLQAYTGDNLRNEIAAEAVSETSVHSEGFLKSPPAVMAK